MIRKDTRVYLHNLGIFLGQGVLVNEWMRAEELLHVTLNNFVGFLNILD